MKIIGLKFKDINPLQGTWEIRFDRPPLADTRLFAIVGPNGSGKTSILDALTLALYGETARMKDPDLEAMSRQAADSFAEATFSVGGSLYRSRWSVRTGSGGPGAAEMSLAGLNGSETILEDRVVRVRARVAELTGLDFKRFCRSVLLAQGELTAFLDALESERAEILEKIIGPELAQDLEDSVHAELEAENEKLLQLEEAAAGFSPLDRDRIKALREARDQAQEGLYETDRLVEELKLQEGWIERVELLAVEESGASETLSAAEALAARLEADLDQLEQARRALPFREEMERLDELRAEADETGARAGSLQTEIESHAHEIGVMEEELKNNRRRLDQARKLIEDRGEDARKAIDLEHRITDESTRFLETVSRYEDLERTLKEKLQQISEVEGQAAEARAQQQELQRWLKEHAADGGLEIGLPVIEKMLAGLEAVRLQMEEGRTRRAEVAKAEQRTANELNDAERAVRKAHRRMEKLSSRKAGREQRLSMTLETDTFEQLSARCREWKDRLASCRKLIKIGRKYRELSAGEDILEAFAQIELRQKALGLSLSEEQARLAELEKESGWRQTVKKYAPDRPLLRPGEPCPLCGALDHPFADQGPPEPEPPDQALVDQRARVEAAHRELRALGAQAAALQPRARALEALRAEWTAVSAQSGEEWAITSIETVGAEVFAIETVIKRLKSRVRSARWQKWRLGWVERAVDRKADKLSEREQQRNRLLDAHEQQLKALADLEIKSNAIKQAEQSAKDELAHRLKDLGESPPKPGAEMELIQRIRQRWDSYAGRRGEEEALEGRLRSLDQLQGSLPGELTELRERARTLGEVVQAEQQKLAALKAEREELFGDTDPARESRELEDEIALATAEQSSWSQKIEAFRRALSDMEQALPEAEERARTAKTAVDEIERGLMDRTVPAGFGSLDELRDSLSDLERLEGTEGKLEEAGKVLAESRLRAAAALAALEAARSERTSVDSIDKVRENIAEAEERRRLLQEEIEAADHSLKQQREIEQGYREAQEALAAQEKICARAEARERSLRSQDPAEKRKKQQRLMFERLLDRANHHLETLNGRYAFRPLSDQGFGLQIEDSLREGARRPLQTLSGGESFLASLCMALGLSEMAAKDRRIESLFLDEGFGSLDDETLYKVMAALKGLRANGKIVGIISHVKRLADEIPTQIRLEKLPGGRSRISVVA